MDEGYSVVHVRDGVTALNMLASSKLRPDLIVCDVRLPGLRGDRLAAELRARFPSARLPVVLMSASADPHVSVRDVSFISKPFDSAELVKRIEGLLANPSESSVAAAS